MQLKKTVGARVAACGLGVVVAMGAPGIAHLDSNIGTTTAAENGWPEVTTTKKATPRSPEIPFAAPKLTATPCPKRTSFPC